MAGFTPSGWSGGGGMPAEMQSALAQKYAIQGQQANTQAYTAASEAALRGAQTQQVAPNAESARALQAAQGKLAGAQATNVGMETFKTGLQTLFTPQQMYDQSRLSNSQATQADAGSRWTNFQTDRQSKLQGIYSGDLMKTSSSQQPRVTDTTTPSTSVTNNIVTAPDAPTVMQPSWTNPAATSLTPSSLYPPDPFSQGAAHLANGMLHPSQIFTGDIAPPVHADGTQHYSRGTARVPGKGLPTKDTVKAKLAPGEAVLNNAAAEMMGRHNIAALNAHGAMAMGMPPATGKGTKHKAGTSGIPSLDALYAEKSPMVSLGAPIAAAGRVSVGAP